MAKILKHSVNLRQDPPIGALVYLEAGTELPDWAEGRVGDHVFEDRPSEKKTESKPAKKLPSAPKKEKSEPDTIEVPHREAHHTKWRAFLEADGTEVPTGTTRDEMVEMALEKFPDLEILEDEE